MSSLPPQGLAYAAIKARQRRDTESFREHIRNTPIYREWKAKNPGPEAATFSRYSSVDAPAVRVAGPEDDPLRDGMRFWSTFGNKALEEIVVIHWLLQGKHTISQETLGLARERLARKGLFLHRKTLELLPDDIKKEMREEMKGIYWGTKHAMPMLMWTDGAAAGPLNVAAAGPVNVAAAGPMGGDDVVAAEPEWTSSANVEDEED